MKKHHKLPGNLSMEEKRKLFQIRISKDIETHGCFVMCVFGSESVPVFAYSIGLLDTFNMPEVIIFGLNPENMAGLINVIVHNLREGQTYEAGQSYKNIAQNLPAYFGRVEDRHISDYFGQAQLHHKREVFPALQMVWSDPSGLFPWQDGFEERFRERQPLLFQVQ